MELITVASLPTPTDAHLLRTLLEAEGISASIFNEHISNTFLPLETAIGGVQLQVRPEDADRARQIIEETEDVRMEELNE